MENKKPKGPIILRICHIQTSAQFLVGRELWSSRSFEPSQNRCFRLDLLREPKELANAKVLGSS